MDYNEFREKVSDKHLTRFADIIRAKTKSKELPNDFIQYMFTKVDFTRISNRKVTDDELLQFVNDQIVECKLSKL